MLKEAYENYKVWRDFVDREEMDYSEGQKRTAIQSAALLNHVNEHELIRYIEERENPTPLFFNVNKRVKCVVVLDYNDFEKYVRKIYDNERYDFVADIECGNDSVHLFNVQSEHYGEYERKRVEEFANGGWPTYITHDLIHDLVERELMEPASYLIEVMW